ncbi:hypothetical protein BDW22DRAFT_1419276 [Trametopsis cervina]|nr:hypothetical protein BDW22DRAFT_1419276 [Trametopsis cervina]
MFNSTVNNLPDSGLPGSSSMQPSSHITHSHLSPDADKSTDNMPIATGNKSPGKTAMDAEEEGRLWHGSPIRRAEPIAHLPTPQSPNNISAYVDPLAFGNSSPIRASSRGSRTNLVAGKRSPSPLDRTQSSTSLITPESSPAFVRKSRSSVASSSLFPSTPNRNSQFTTAMENMSALDTMSRLSPLSTPSPRSLNLSNSSVLSSPFVDKSERRTPNIGLSGHSPDHPAASPIDAEDLYRQAKTPPPLPAPIPQRIGGSEITRIRLQLAAEQAALLQDTEARRPDYLKRTKRPMSDLDDDGGDRENIIPSLGVMDSPVKGRRLALFQETSEESFEQSLLAGGYPTYGLAPAYGEPSTPQAGGKSALSQRAVEWLQHATPGQQPPPQTPGAKEEPDIVFSEQELRKRRRLAAFGEHNTLGSRKTLYPVELEGHGRVLLDQVPEVTPPQSTESPSKKRGNPRRKRGGVHDSPSRRRHQPNDLHEDVETGRPNWLDQAFPWSMRAHEREETAQKEQERKLKWIERYLERESDEDEEENQSLGLPSADLVDPPQRTGRGKMVPLASNVGEQPQTPSSRRRVYYPSDPADARAALLSKRSVRALASRRRQELEEVVCICRGRDDGRELVQCDDCKEWYHLECIGISDISMLGKEEDPWFCADCLGIPNARSSSPTFVPTDDRPVSKTRRDPLFFQGAIQESPPGIPWHASRIPKTPVRGSDFVPQLSSRSSWDDSSSQVGPETPSTGHRASRVYDTPKTYTLLEDSFDPLSTPSRGMHFSGPFATPMPSAFWGTRASALQTPSRPSKKPLAPWAFDTPHDESSPFRPPYDDSPVRRSQVKPDKHVYAARALQESPLAARSTSIPGFGRSRSPLFGKGSIDRTHSRSALS